MGLEILLVSRRQSECGAVAGGNMPRAGAFYITLALLFVALPAGLLYFGTVPAFLMAVVLGLLAYGFVLLLLVGCFWRRWRYGEWPSFFGDDFPEEGPPAPSPYQFSRDALMESCLLVRQAAKVEKDERRQIGVTRRDG
jgi:hypothetical protein